jgi:hypothetical protein
MTKSYPEPSGSPIPAQNNINSMQRVSECESVVFYEAAASPAGWPPPKPLSIQKVFDCKWYNYPRKRTSSISKPALVKRGI